MENSQPFRRFVRIGRIGSWTMASLMALHIVLWILGTIERNSFSLLFAVGWLALHFSGPAIVRRFSETT